MLQAVIASYPNHPFAEKLKIEYARIIGAPVPDGPVPERALFEAGLAYGESPTESDLSDLVSVLEHAVLREQLNTTAQALRRAELSGDTEAIASLITTYKELSARLALF